jgi:hypothetical protein
MTILKYYFRILKEKKMCLNCTSKYVTCPSYSRPVYIPQTSASVPVSTTTTTIYKNLEDQRKDQQFQNLFKELWPNLSNRLNMNDYQLNNGLTSQWINERSITSIINDIERNKIELAVKERAALNEKTLIEERERIEFETKKKENEKILAEIELYRKQKEEADIKQRLEESARLQIELAKMQNSNCNYLFHFFFKSKKLIPFLL